MMGFLSLATTVAPFSAGMPGSDGHHDGTQPVLIYSRAADAETPAVSIENLLVTAPGVQMTSHSVLGRAPMPYLRGSLRAHGSPLAITIDGIQIDDSLFGNPLTYMRFLPLSVVKSATLETLDASRIRSAGGYDGRLHIDTTVDQTVAGMNLGHNGPTTFSLQRGAFARGQLRSGRHAVQGWLFTQSDEGFRQDVRDRSGRRVSTIDPHANQGFGLRYRYGPFRGQFLASYHSARRGLAFGYKSHTNRTRQSFVGLRLAWEPTEVEHPGWSYFLQLSEGKVSAVGLAAPGGTVLDSVALDRPFILNTWYTQYSALAGMQRNISWGRWGDMQLRLQATDRWLAAAKRQATHSAADDGYAAVTNFAGPQGQAELIPSVHRYGADASAAYSVPLGALHARVALSLLASADRVSPNDVRHRIFEALPQATLAWKHGYGKTFLHYGRLADVLPMRVLYVANHPLIDPLRGRTSAARISRLEVRHRLARRWVAVEAAAFWDQHSHEFSLEEISSDCAAAQCVPRHRYTSLGRYGVMGGSGWITVSNSVHGLSALVQATATGHEAARLNATVRGWWSAGPRGVLSLSAQGSRLPTIGMSWLLNAAWTLPLTPWMRMKASLTNALHNRVPGPRGVLPDGYPARGTVVSVHLQFSRPPSTPDFPLPD